MWRIFRGIHTGHDLQEYPSAFRSSCGMGSGHWIVLGALACFLLAGCTKTIVSQRGIYSPQQLPEQYRGLSTQRFSQESPTDTRKADFRRGRDTSDSKLLP